MRILIWLRKLEIGGGQVNAMNLANGLMNRGHEVYISAEAGELVKLLRDKIIPFYEIKYSYMKHPNIAFIRKLAQIIKILKVDILHAIEGTVPSAIETYIAGIWAKTPVLQSWQGNWIPSYPIYFPQIGPVTVSAKYLIDDMVDSGWPKENLIYWGARIKLEESPHDWEVNDFRKKSGLDQETTGIVTVSRLDKNWNFEMLKMIIYSIDILSAREIPPIKLIIVGDGEGRGTLENISRRINKKRGKNLIKFMGAMTNPLPAYQAADIVVGRSSSLLRAMALGKACIAVGNNWSCIVNEENFKELEYYQFWRNLPTNEVAVESLANKLEYLIMNRTYRNHIGKFSKEMVSKHYDLNHGVLQMESIYKDVIQNQRKLLGPTAWSEILKSLFSLYLHRFKRKIGFKRRNLSPSRAGYPYVPENRVVVKEMENEEVK